MEHVIHFYIKNTFTVTFDQFNASLLNKLITFLKNLADLKLLNGSILYIQSMMERFFKNYIILNYNRLQVALHFKNIVLPHYLPQKELKQFTKKKKKHFQN